jgi:hypothetical protein
VDQCSIHHGTVLAQTQHKAVHVAQALLAVATTLLGAVRVGKDGQDLISEDGAVEGLGEVLARHEGDGEVSRLARVWDHGD